MNTCIPRILKNMQYKNEKRQYQLNNGLKCVLLNSKEKGIAHKVILSLTIKCGSMKSDVYKKETAHLLEHIQMSFDKDKKNPKKYFFAKASTNFFSTTFYISCCFENLEFCLNLLASVYSDDRITKPNREEALLEVFRESEVRHRDNRGILAKNTYLFKDSSFEKYLLNTDIEKALDITISDLKEFHNKWYKTVNSQLTIVFGHHDNFYDYEKRINKILGKIKGELIEENNIDIRQFDICNNQIYNIKNDYNMNPMLCFFELKQYKGFITEKIQKGLFFQYTQDLLDVFFNMNNLNKYKFNIMQFENHSFIFIFEFPEILDIKIMISMLCQFFYNKPSILKEKISLMKKEMLDIVLTSHEFMEYIENSFVYKQPFNYISIDEMVRDIVKIVNDFDVNSILNIVKELETAKYKAFVYEQRSIHE